MKKKENLISVIIPCYNGIRTIGKTLEALTNQVTDHVFEIIVIDSSNDGTDAMISKQFPHVRLIHLEEKTLPGSGRNLGVREAKGKFVAFTDSDCIPQPDWLARIMERFRLTECDAVGGSVKNGYPKNYIAWVSHLIEFNEWTPGRRAGWERNNPSCNLAIKREAFDRYKLEFTDNFPSEDTLLNWHLYDRGGKLYYDPSAMIVHLNRSSFRKLFKHQYRLGRMVAVERALSGNPGKLFLKVKILCLALPFLRWIMALGRLLKNDTKTAFIFLGLTPLWIPAATAWALGFMKGGEPRDAAIRIHEKDNA
jgi:glycosyltransferase involved in cell wall biosynthesis